MGTAARIAFMHGFKLGGNLLQRAIGGGGRNMDDKAQKPVITVQPSRLSPPSPRRSAASLSGAGAQCSRRRAADG